MSRCLTLLAFVIGCGGAPASSRPPSPAPAAATTETGAATTCTRDDDCACRRFDGATFQPGREASTCCTQASGCVDALGRAVPAGHCMTCVYD